MNDQMILRAAAMVNEGYGLGYAIDSQKPAFMKSDVRDAVEREVLRKAKVLEAKELAEQQQL